MIKLLEVKSLFFLAIMLFLTVLLYSSSVFAEEMEAALTTDAEIAGELKLLVGEGNGLTEEYLGKPSTRMQAAIISLRLSGKLQEAMQYNGDLNFSDKNSVGKQNQAILGYLKAHPELGWLGSGDGNFNPLAIVSSQQFYKVMLESLGYRSGPDFNYMETESFAMTKGLSQIAGTPMLTNAHIATALVETLTAITNEGNSLFESLKSSGIISTAAALPQGDRIMLAVDSELGTYLSDGSGRTLYFFTKDAENPDACQGNCLENWPIFYEENLVIPAMLDKADFGAHIRADGTKQLTYKGWPLYTFIQDKAYGDVNGEAVNQVWFVAKPDYAVMIGTSTELGHYLTDDYGNTLYYFDKDTPQTSVCEGQCSINWPSYDSSEAAVPSTLTASDFASIIRAEGNTQMTYKGYPLYYFAKDENRGNTAGHGFNNVWMVVNPYTFDGTTASTAAKEKTYHVDIRDFSFGTAPLSVEKGSKIVFTNYDDAAHNAVAVTGAFSTPLLMKGESYTITLTEAGTYEYFCEPHKRFMTGTIVVQ